MSVLLLCLQAMPEGLLRSRAGLRPVRSRQVLEPDRLSKVRPQSALGSTSGIPFSNVLLCCSCIIDATSASPASIPTSRTRLPARYVIASHRTAATCFKCDHDLFLCCHLQPCAKGKSGTSLAPCQTCGVGRFASQIGSPTCAESVLRNQSCFEFGSVFRDFAAVCGMQV